MTCSRTACVASPGNVGDPKGAAEHHKALLDEAMRLFDEARAAFEEAQRDMAQAASQV